MTVFYQNLCYNEESYKGTQLVLYLLHLECKNYKAIFFSSSSAVGSK